MTPLNTSRQLPLLLLLLPLILWLFSASVSAGSFGFDDGRNYELKLSPQESELFGKGTSDGLSEERRFVNCGLFTSPVETMLVPNVLARRLPLLSLPLATSKYRMTSSTIANDPWPIASTDKSFLCFEIGGRGRRDTLKDAVNADGGRNLPPRYFCCVPKRTGSVAGVAEKPASPPFSSEGSRRSSALRKRSREIPDQLKTFWSSSDGPPRLRQFFRRSQQSKHYDCLKKCIDIGKIHPIQCHTLC